MSTDEPETRTTPKRLILIIVAAAMIPILASAYLLYSRLGANAKPEFDPVADYLASPETIPERAAAVGTDFLSIEVSRGGLELYDTTGQRHSISPNGELLERGGTTTATQAFALSAVDFTKLPAVIAQATTEGRGSANSATVEIIEGALSWRISVWGEGGTKELVYPLP